MAQAKRKNKRRPTSAPKRRRKGRTAFKALRVGPKATVLIAVATVLAVIAAVVSPYIHRAVTDIGADVPRLAVSTGGFAIDVSHYQGEIVWDSLAVMIDRKGRTVREIMHAKDVYPVEYAFIKATEGVSMVDPAFSDYWQGAGGSRVVRGAYHFFRSSKDAVKQAQNFIRTVGPLTANDLPPVLDVETMHKGCTKEQLNAGVKAWLEAVEAYYKRKPIIYASDSYLRDILSKDLTSRYPVWVAHYSVGKPYAADWNAWQFTDKAVVHGADGKVDLSCVKGF